MRLLKLNHVLRQILTQHIPRFVGLHFVGNVGKQHDQIAPGLAFHGRKRHAESHDPAVGTAVDNLFLPVMGMCAKNSEQGLAGGVRSFGGHAREAFGNSLAQNIGWIDPKDSAGRSIEHDNGAVLRKGEHTLAHAFQHAICICATHFGHDSPRLFYTFDFLLRPLRGFLGVVFAGMDGRRVGVPYVADSNAVLLDLQTRTTTKVHKICCFFNKFLTVKAFAHVPRQGYLN
ncbi:MAG: hypothetical protein V3571_11720 [Pseudodesulfovibrio sp.]